MSDLSENRIQNAVLQHLFEMLYGWTRKVRSLSYSIEQEGIILQVHKEYEANEQRNFDWDWASTSAESEAKIDKDNNELVRAKKEVENWEKIIEYTAEKFGLELYKTTEGGGDGWHPKPLSFPLH